MQTNFSDITITIVFETVSKENGEPLGPFSKKQSKPLFMENIQQKEDHLILFDPFRS